MLLPSGDDRVSAAEALAAGLVNRVVPKGGALELNIFIETNETAEPRVGRLPGTRHRQLGTQYASMLEVEDLNLFLAELHATCAAQNIPAGATLKDFAPGDAQQLGPMTRPGTEIEEKVSLPLRWEAALDASDAGKVLPRYLGERYHQLYGACRCEECARFHAEISDRDYE